MYVLGARRTLRRTCRRVELHHVPTGAVVGWDHTEESLARHVRRAEAMADEAQAADEAYAAAARAGDGMVDAAWSTSSTQRGPVRRAAGATSSGLCPEGRAAAQARESLERSVERAARRGAGLWR